MFKFKVGDEVVVKYEGSEMYKYCYIINQTHFDIQKGRTYYRIGDEPRLVHETWLELKEIWNSPLAHAMSED